MDSLISDLELQCRVFQKFFTLGQEISEEERAPLTRHIQRDILRTLTNRYALFSSKLGGSFQEIREVAMAKVYPIFNAAIRCLAEDEVKLLYGIAPEKRNLKYRLLHRPVAIAINGPSQFVFPEQKFQYLWSCYEVEAFNILNQSLERK